MPTHVFDLGAFSALDHLIFFVRGQERVISCKTFQVVLMKDFLARCSVGSTPLAFSCGGEPAAFSGFQPCCL